MEFKRINDCVICPLPSLRSEYLFSMKQEPNFLPQQQRFDQYLNVFCLLYKDVNDEMYYYLGTVSNSYSPREHIYQYNRTYFQTRLFPVKIDRQLYPHLSEYYNQQSQSMAREWRQIMRNHQFMMFCRRLLQVDKEEFHKIGVLTRSRYVKMWNCNVYVS
jgi:hypothetical protein